MPVKKVIQMVSLPCGTGRYIASIVQLEGLLADNTASSEQVSGMVFGNDG
jgi:hypothetical protein